MNFMERFSKKTKKSILFGGVANIENQDFYFFHSTSQELLKKFKKKFKHIQGSHGSYPEMMLLKRYLGELGYDTGSVLDLYPMQQRKCFEMYLKLLPIHLTEISEEAVRNEYLDLINQLKNLKIATTKSDLINHYISFFHSWLSPIPCTFIVKDPKIYRVVFDRISKIKKLLKDVQNCSFQENLSRFHLAVDYIQYLLIFFKIDRSKETLIELLNKSSPLINQDIDKQSFTFTSGIACYGNISDALITLFKNDSNNHSPNAYFEEKSYYELTESHGSLRKCMEGYFKCTVQSLTEFKTIENLVEQDIIFTDLYPNRVVFKSVKKIEIEDIINYILKTRLSKPEKKSPLVVVVDCATTFFIHEEFQNLLSNLGPSIKDGKLILILTNSFAKYFMGGCDKFPGGGVQVFSSRKAQNARSLCYHLMLKSKDDHFSVEADRTFYLLLKHCSSNILSYLEMIRKNTNSIYQICEDNKLIIDQKEQWNQPIHVGFKDKEIPMLGLHFNYMNTQLFGASAKDDTLHIIVVIMQYYLYAKFVEKNLPITMKQSFGFAACNLIECWSALRLTVGLETELLPNYAEVINTANNDLNKLLSSSKQQLSKKIQELTAKKLKKNMYMKQTIILESAKDGFEAILDYLGTISKNKRNRKISIPI